MQVFVHLFVVMSLHLYICLHFVTFVFTFFSFVIGALQRLVGILVMGALGVGLLGGRFGHRLLGVCLGHLLLGARKTGLGGRSRKMTKNDQK